MNQTQELIKLKEKIDSTKTEFARIEGQISQIEQQREQNLGCSSDEEAELYIQELDEEIASLDKDIKEGIQTVKEELGW